MAGVIAFLVFIVVVGYLYLRMLRKRDELEPEVKASAQPRMSRREKRLQKLRRFDEPMPEPKTIQELMMEELEETRANEIPGAEGIEVPVLLRVWHRDSAVRAGCADGALRYVVNDGVDRTKADVDDVFLICDTPRSGVDGEGEEDVLDAALADHGGLGTTLPDEPTPDAEQPAASEG